jgi:hypothetical protein
MIRMTPFVWYLPRRRRICGVDKKPGTGLHNDNQPGIMRTMGKERRNLLGMNHLLCHQTQRITKRLSQQNGTRQNTGLA